MIQVQVQLGGLLGVWTIGSVIPLCWQAGQGPTDIALISAFSCVLPIASIDERGKKRGGKFIRSKNVKKPKKIINILDDRINIQIFWTESSNG